MGNFLNKLSYLILIFLLCLISIQFSSLGVEPDIYNQLRLLVIAILLVLFVISFKNPWYLIRSRKILKIHLFITLFFTCLLFIFFAFNDNIDFDPVIDLSIVFIIILIGLNINLNKKQLSTVIILFIVLNSIAALSIVYTYATGFIIHQLYLPVPKNQISPVYAFSFMLSLYYTYKYKGTLKILLYTTSFLLILSLFVLRGRAAILAVFIAISFWLFYYIKKKKIIYLYILMIIFSLYYGWDFVYDSLFLNRDLTDIDSISAGRFDNYLRGVSYFFKYPLFGELTGPEFKGIDNSELHNYILINIVRYGILLSSMLFIVYFSYLHLIFRKIKNNNYGVLDVTFLLFLMLFVVSMFEYGPPFGSGTMVFFPFFLFGQYVKNFK